MQEITLTIQVKTNAAVSPEEIAKIVQRLIDVGLEDAGETAMCGEGDFEAAQLAADRHIGAPAVAKLVADFFTQDDGGKSVAKYGREIA
jgi:hypothetical protein